MKQFSTRRLAAALLLSLIVSFGISGMLDRQNTGMLRRGDFPAFYAAAKIVKQGQGSELYSRHLQQTIENQYWPSLNGNYFAFAYPASFAFFLSPLANFSPLEAKLVFLVVQLFFFSLAFLLLREREPPIRRRPLEYLAIFLSFAPLFVGIAAGQGASVNLFLAILVMTFLERGRRWEHHAILGAVLGVWLFKPQLSLVALLLCSAACQPLALFSGWMLGAAATYFAGYLACGPLWPSQWLGQTSSFAFADFAANGFQMISFFAVSGELFAKLGPDRETGAIVGMLLSVLFLAAAFLGIVKSAEPRWRAGLLLGPVMLLCSGHVLFYEAGLMLPALIQLTARRKHPLRLMVIINVFAFVCCMLRESWPMQPLFFLALATALAGFVLAPGREQKKMPPE